MCVLPLIKSEATFNTVIAQLPSGGYYILSDGSDPFTVLFKLYIETTHKARPLYRIKRDLIFHHFPAVREIIARGDEVVLNL